MVDDDNDDDEHPARINRHERERGSKYLFLDDHAPTCQPRYRESPCSPLDSRVPTRSRCS